MGIDAPRALRQLRAEEPAASRNGPTRVDPEDQKLQNLVEGMLTSIPRRSMGLPYMPPH